MAEKKEFKCFICGFVLEIDEQEQLPPCPKCGADDWQPVVVAAEHPGLTGFEQVIPPDITESAFDVAALAAVPELPREEAAAESAAVSNPFARPEETGFEHVLAADLTQGSTVPPSPVIEDPPVNEAEAKVDDYAFKRPHDTGFEQIVPEDISLDMSRAAYGSIIGPADDGKSDGHAFAQPEQTGFEHVIPLDFTESGTGAIVDPLTPVPGQEEPADEPKEKVDPFGQPPETGFEQFIPAEITESDPAGILTMAIFTPVTDGHPATPGIKRYRCDACGLLVEVTKEGEQLPPCPVCGGLGVWMEVEE